MKKYLLIGFAVLALAARLPAQNRVTATLSAAAANCATTNVCLVLPTPNMGSSTFTVSANASGNTIQFEGTANGGTTWVALNATPSNSTTAATSTTGTGTWQANIAAYTAVRLRMSNLVGGTTTVTISTSAVSAKSGGGGGGGVTSITGDGTIITNVASSGAVTLTTDTTTGSGGIVLATSPVLTTPNLGTPSAVTLTNATGYAFPLTVTGGVSGAPPCFTSTTALGAGTLLATNALVVGGGSGVCPATGNGDFTYATHTLSAGAAGLVDLSAETGSNAFKIPVGSGCTASSNGALCFNTTSNSLTASGNPQYHTTAIPGTNCLLMNGSGSSALAVCATQLVTSAFCKANGTAASPSVVSCGANPAGMFSCATNASGATCQVNTTIVTANSQIFITQNAADGGAGQLNVTCNTANDLPTTAPIIASKSAGASFTINVGTISTNPACFEYLIVN